MVTLIVTYLITKLRKPFISFFMSVRPPACNNSAPTLRIVMKFEICLFFENTSRKLNFLSNMTRITGTLREDKYKFLILSRSFLPRMKNVSGKSCRENQNKLFMFNNVFFYTCVVYEIMWKNNDSTTQYR